jgi:hypothetical protein
MPFEVNHLLKWEKMTGKRDSKPDFSTGGRTNTLGRLKKLST